MRLASAHRRAATALALAGSAVMLAAAGQGNVAVASRSTAPHLSTTVGHGNPASCRSAAVVSAVAKGGVITFNCGPDPVTITMKHTAKVVNTSHRIVIDGGGLVTLSGAGKRRILYLNTCDPKQTYTTSHCQDQKWPDLVIRDITFTRGRATEKQNDPLGVYGGGAIFARGGRLSVTGATFTNNRCNANGPDLGGAAIRALSEFDGEPVVLSHDDFRGGRCSNGSATSSIGVSWLVSHCTMTGNRAIGHGANPARNNTPGGGSGGAIYTDGDTYNVVLNHTVIKSNHANEGGGAIFFVSNDRTGKLVIKNSTLHHNPSAGFETAGYPGIFYLGVGQHPKVSHSTIN